MSADAPRLEELLVRERPMLLAWLERRAGKLTRYESPEDLAQAVHLRALQARERFRYEGEEAFRAWLVTLAQNHLVDRRQHWAALKRGASRVVRWTLGEGSQSGAAARLPASSSTSPSGFAARRELLAQCARALAALPERDRQLVRWQSEGVPLAEQAERLGLSYAATQRAGLRALERLRKVWRLL